MTLREMTAESLKKQIDDDEKALEELKKCILAKRVTVRVMEKQAEKNKPELPNRFLNTVKFKLTGVFARAHRRAEGALDDPDSYVAKNLEHEALTLYKKCKEIPDCEHKKAGRFTLEAASIVMRLEAAVEQLHLTPQLHQALQELAEALDEQIQRLRTTPKAGHEKFEEAIEALNS